jgi:hypothetical protein
MSCARHETLECHTPWFHIPITGLFKCFPWPIILLPSPHPEFTPKSALQLAFIQWGDCCPTPEQQGEDFDPEEEGLLEGAGYLSLKEKYSSLLFDHSGTWLSQ